jgi:hypothetical protein
MRERHSSGIMSVTLRLMVGQAASCAIPNRARVSSLWVSALLVATDIGRGVRMFRYGASGCAPHPARVIHESTWAASRQNSHYSQVRDSIDGAAPSERPPQLETLLSEIFLAWRFAPVPSSVSYLYSLSLPQNFPFADFASSILAFAVLP